MLSDVTAEWVSSTDMKHREPLGQYMTPSNVRDLLLDHVNLKPGMSVLDPAAGTGELLRGALDRCEVHAEGWDVDPRILRFAERNIPEADLNQVNALDAPATEAFDLVIANPPYFQIKQDLSLKQRYGDVISGRANIFACFFKVAMNQAKTGGQIAFIVPPAMNGGAYFTALRSFILENGKIEYLKVLDRHDLFHSANVSVQLIVIRKGERGAEHVFQHESAGHVRKLFCENPDRLAAEYTGRRTLHETGFRAFTGPVTWNTRKGDLGRGDGAVRLYWAHHIGHGDLLHIEKEGKPGWIRNQTPLQGPAVLVNRVIGKVGGGRIRATLVDGPFTAENHVNVIVKQTDSGVLWERLVYALTEESVTERLKLLTGNTQLSATELTHHFPLDI